MTFFLKTFAYIIKSLPRKLALVVGVCLGWMAGIIFLVRKKVCTINLDMAFENNLSSKEKWKILIAMYANLGKNLVDFLRLPQITKENFSSFVTVEGEEILDSARKKGKGVLGITAHYGFWDIIPLYFAFKGYGANFITKEIQNPSVNDFWMKYRTYGGVNPITKKSSSKEIISILKKNESLGFVIDQNMNTRNGVFVDFFGVKACTIDIVAKLAMNYGSPVLPMFCIRNPDDTFTIKIEEPVLLVEGETKKETIVKTTESYVSVLERYIRERPDHWIWMHKRWKTRPEGEGPIYP